MIAILEEIERIVFVKKKRTRTKEVEILIICWRNSLVSHWSDIIHAP